ncbi:hypothetical protein Pcinc_000524 [Petrolisthes cinctipes]|uniref:N-acetylglucosaminylphosphatidylinositol deacetylase n=1 Tax=Petrolisthes cinctipes TaxID=88211 RepID=A0AAE1GPM2_PETCI|nr:hypothetical protein Pcinc_000524 [Petrolisthes cinctipes]
MVIVACCAGLGLTLSYFTFGSHRFPHHNNNNNNNNKQQVTPTDGNSSEGQGVGRGVDSKQRVLVVTAHPDDEVMFFGPTILHYTQHTNTTLYLLCLSNVHGSMRQTAGEASQQLIDPA